MRLEEFLDWAKTRDFDEEVSPEDVANAMFQNGSIKLSEYLKIIEKLKEIGK